MDAMLQFVALLALAALGENQDNEAEWFGQHQRWVDPKVSREPFIEAGPVHDRSNPRAAYVTVLLPGGHYANRYTRRHLTLF